MDKDIGRATDVEGGIGGKRVVGEDGGVGEVGN